MSLPRTRSTKEKTIAPENASSTPIVLTTKLNAPALISSFANCPFTSEPRWKSLVAHGADLGEIYGHSVVYHAPSESLYLFGGSSRTGTFHNNVMRFNLRTNWFFDGILLSIWRSESIQALEMKISPGTTTLASIGNCRGVLLLPSCIPADPVFSCVFVGIQRWDVVTTTGKRPKGRHFHSAVLLDHNMYIFGGKCNGYMNDISCLNLGTV